MQDAADTFATICRERGLNSTKSGPARELALKMAEEAFGDSDIGCLISEIRRAHAINHDLIHKPFYDIERQDLEDGLYKCGEEVMGYAETISEQFQSGTVN